MIWENGQLTNQGPLVLELEKKVESYLGVRNLHFLTNGTIALQIAIKALGVSGGEIITTPFSYVATTSSILWEGCTPVFVDINEDDLCIDVTKIESAITTKTKAIMAVHVFGNPCDVEGIEDIAKRHGLKVIYDGAHAFGVKHKGKSLLSYGDISMCSFHATKVFHTIEGGCLVVKDKSVSDKIEMMKKFGHFGDDHRLLGINAKASEFQAAMGLVNLKHVDSVMQDRKDITEKYDKELASRVDIIQFKSDSRNYSYYPVLFENEAKLMIALKRLASKNIFPRRYFYPSLNKLKYLPVSTPCPISEDISLRILCLPIYSGLKQSDVKIISDQVR